MNSAESNKKCIEMLGEALANMGTNDNHVEVKLKNNKWIAKSEHVNQYHNKYYHNKVGNETCELCGSEVKQYKLARHQQSKKCQKKAAAIQQSCACGKHQEDKEMRKLAIEKLIKHFGEDLVHYI